MQALVHVGIAVGTEIVLALGALEPQRLIGRPSTRLGRNQALVLRGPKGSQTSKAVDGWTRREGGIENDVATPKDTIGRYHLLLLLGRWERHFRKGRDGK